MALPLTFVGIDVAKDWLDLWLEPLKRFERVANQAAGWAALIERLQALGPPAGIIVAFEASGGYERGLRTALLTPGSRYGASTRCACGSMPEASAATPRTIASTPA